ncbi:MAG TPA: type II toxin-antitoxin system PemK/MazF family toxin [Terriglobia bacterium]|nr:type II toxin-antitoxin system PemK/MazF family toxin [Terriglobia bacterium]
MRRGDLYRVPRPQAKDPKSHRIFVVVSRQVLIDSGFSTVICAPVYSRQRGLATEVPISIEEGLKHESAICCDELISLEKVRLTNYIGSLTPEKISQLNHALSIAVGLA